MDSARQLIQASVIDGIKKKNKLKYWQIAESIGLHETHVQKVSKGIRLLSEEKFDLLCKVWNIDLAQVVNQLELDNLDYLRWKTITLLIRARKVDLDYLAKETGISLLDFMLVEHHKRDLSREEIEKIAKVFDVEPHIIDEGLLAVTFELMEKGMNAIHVPPSVIESVIKFVESEI